MSATYTKLKSGEWGVRVQGTSQANTKCEVTLKNGTKKWEKLSNLIWEGDGVQIYAIAKPNTEEDTQEIPNSTIVDDFF